VVALVFWSFVMAITPLTLGLAWELISSIGDLIGQWLSRAFDHTQQQRVLRHLCFDQPSGSISTAGRTPGKETGRFLALHYPGPA
jgi:hypothetical protein